MERRVISFCLFEHAYQYLRGLVENCQDINRIYPDFWIYVYLGNDFDRSIMLGKFDTISNLKFIETNMSGSINMCYRFFPIDDDDVSIAFSRDADSRINERDQYSINTFIESNKTFQIIRDNKDHKRKIMGGMWGIKKGCIDFKLRDRFNEYFFRSDRNRDYQCDQDFLSSEIYDRVVSNALVFDDYKHFPEEDSVGLFPPCKVFEGHVGSRIESSYPEYEPIPPPINIQLPIINIQLPIVNNPPSKSALSILGTLKSFSIKY